MSTHNLIRRADDGLRAAQRAEDSLSAAWWAGYKRGLRRAHQGEEFGTAEEHQLYHAAADSADATLAAIGRGYRSGLTLEPRDPDFGAK